MRWTECYVARLSTGTSNCFSLSHMILPPSLSFVFSLSLSLSHSLLFYLFILLSLSLSRSLNLEYRDDGYLQLVLKILGLMCDGQNATLQDYLREQVIVSRTFLLFSLSLSISPFSLSLSLSLSLFRFNS